MVKTFGYTTQELHNINVKGQDKVFYPEGTLVYIDEFKDEHNSYLIVASNGDRLPFDETWGRTDFIHTKLLVNVFEIDDQTPLAKLVLE